MKTENRHHNGPLHTAPGACDACGEEGVTITIQAQRFRYGEGEAATELMADVPVHECSKCGLSYTDHEAENIRHAAVCRHLNRLTPSEIRAIRRIHGASQEQFSEASGIGVASLARWETGAVIQNAGYDKYLRLLGDSGNYTAVQNLNKPKRAAERRYEGPRRFPSLDETGRARTRQSHFSLSR